MPPPHPPVGKENQVGKKGRGREEGRRKGKGRGREEGREEGRKGRELKEKGR